MLLLGVLGPAVATQDATAEESRYSVAGGCYALRAEAVGRFVATDGDGYRASASRVDGAEGFRMQATDLGEYLLYGERRDFLAGGSDLLSGDRAESAPEPSPAADWRLTRTSPATLTLSLRANGKVLATSRGGDELVLEDAGFVGERARFDLEPASGCRRYPEPRVGASGRPFTGGSPYAEVQGLLDSHLHLGAFEFLGGAHCGRPWHRYGAPYALVDCPDHEPNGSTAVLENALSGNPAQTHDTTGWPTFRDWPDHDSLTHEQTYYKWLERAWRGGLRLIVNDLVENRVLCELYPPTNELARGKTERCDEMASARLQLRRMHQLQDYIDAQEGGPGKGWFRLVESPFEARRVINDGKVAVVLGIETSELFGCGLGPGPHCDRTTLRAELDRFYDLGVRSLFPVHKFDNALGGTRFDAGTTGAAVNTGNFYATGQFWDAETCPPELKGQHDNPQSTSAPSEPDVIASGFFALMPDETPAVPVYPPPPHCNTRGLTGAERPGTGLGEYLIRLMMRRGMIVEPDHMSVRAKNDTLGMLEEQNYSGVIASHSWSDPSAWPRIYELGGMVTPITSASEDFVEEWRALRQARSERFYFGMGFGADSNGLHVQPPPSENAAENPVTYPFQSFDGGVTLRRQRSGQRVWDVNVDGVDHYGLHPDWVEDLRLVGGERIVRDLGRGAEAYLQMWERAVGVPPERCRPSEGSFSSTALGALRLGDSPTAALRSAGQPTSRSGRSYRYCVEGSSNGASVAAVFTRGGSLGLLATDASGYDANGVSPGDPARALTGTRRLGDGLRVERTAEGTAFVYRLRDREVRSVGVAAASVTASADTLQRHMAAAF